MKNVCNIVTVGAALSLAAAAPAQTWNEAGDAGQTIAGAQNTIGSGSLQFLNGTLDGSNDVDIYCINITDEALFRAQVTSFAGNDTMLWLFNTDGTVQVLNDDIGTNLLSTITSQGVFNNGVYYLGISRWPNEGLNAGDNSLFMNVFWPGPDQQQVMGNGTTLDHWSSNATGAGGAYEITLRGAEFCAVPTPGAGGVALLGLGGLLGGRRRR